LRDREQDRFRGIGNVAICRHLILRNHGRAVPRRACNSRKNEDSPGIAGEMPGPANLVLLRTIPSP
jgi:hypothetical protein